MKSDNARTRYLELFMEKLVYYNIKHGKIFTVVEITIQLLERKMRDCI